MPPHAPDPETQREARLAQVLDQLVELARRGEPLPWEAVLREHPDLADELRELWPTVQIAEELARPAAVDALLASRLEQTPLQSQLPTLLGDYEVLAEIGRGGMGIVFKARQRSLGRVVALKMILDSALASEAERQRFRTEAKAAARLDHPGIVPVYDTGEFEGRPYFTMKYVEGPTLAQLAAAGPLPVRQAARYVLKVAEAVHYAHTQGILHRDLKPSNVIVDKEGQPHVTDFGLAKRFSPPAATADRPDAGFLAGWSSAGQQSAWHTSLTQPGAILGTPSYMAPEQAGPGRGKLSPASDVYSLGAILYYLLTSRPPFQASNPVDVLLQVMERDPLPPRLLNPNVDSALEAICLKALQKQPKLRYASAAEMAADLRAYLDGHRVAASSEKLSSMLARIFRPARSEPGGGLPKGGWIAAALTVLVWGGVSSAMLKAGLESHWTCLVVSGAVLLSSGGIITLLLRRQGALPETGRQTIQILIAAALAGFAVQVIEMLLGLPIFQLLPILAVIAGMMFMTLAGALSTRFYPVAGSCFVAVILLPWLPGPTGLLVLTVLVAVGFLVPLLQRKH